MAGVSPGQHEQLYQDRTWQSSSSDHAMLTVGELTGSQACTRLSETQS